MRRITASCCQSFSPNSATSGRTWLNSLHDHRRHPVEMAGPRRAAQALAHAGDRDGGGEAVGIHFLDRGRPQQVDALGLEQRESAASWRG